MCWKGKQTIYQDIYDFIDDNPDNEKLKEFEERLADISLINYNAYIYRFKKRMTFAEIAKRLDVETHRVTTLISEVALAFEMFFDVHM